LSVSRKLRDLVAARGGTREDGLAQPAE